MRNFVMSAARVVAVLLAVTVMGAACTTTQSPETQVSDSWIHSKVKAKLTTEQFSNITNIDVNVTNGIVSLAGEVPDTRIRAEAESAAWSIEGVRKVINNLQVKERRPSDEPVM